MHEQVPCRGAEIGLLGRKHTGHLFDIFRGLFDKDVHRVVEGYDTDHPVVLIQDRQGEEVIPGEHLGDGLLVGQGVHRNHVFIHDLGHRGAVVRLKEQRLCRDGAQQTALIRDVAGVDGLLVHAGLPDALEGLLHRHGGPERNVLRRHDGSGGVLRIAQDFVDFFPHLRIRLRENALDYIGGHFLDQVRSVVHVKLAHDVPQLPVGKAPDQKLLPFRFQLGEGLCGKLLRKQPEQKRCALLILLLKNCRDIRRLQRNQNVPQRLELLLVQKLSDRFLESNIAYCHRDPSFSDFVQARKSDTQAEVLFSCDGKRTDQVTVRSTSAR